MEWNNVLLKAERSNVHAVAFVFIALHLS
jgi:hypothetical protein